jgi:hypothetical protein
VTDRVNSQTAQIGGIALSTIQNLAKLKRPSKVRARRRAAARVERFRCLSIGIDSRSESSQVD